MSAPTKLKAPLEIMDGENGRAFVSHNLIVRSLNGNQRKPLHTQDRNISKAQLGKSINYTSNYKHKGSNRTDKYDIVAYSNVKELMNPSWSKFNFNSAQKKPFVPISIKVIGKARDVDSQPIDRNEKEKQQPLHVKQADLEHLKSNTGSMKWKPDMQNKANYSQTDTQGTGTGIEQKQIESLPPSVKPNAKQQDENRKTKEPPGVLMDQVREVIHNGSSPAGSDHQTNTKLPEHPQVSSSDRVPNVSRIQTIPNQSKVSLNNGLSGSNDIGRQQLRESLNATLHKINATIQEHLYRNSKMKQNVWNVSLLHRMVRDTSRQKLQYPGMPTAEHAKQMGTNLFNIPNRNPQEKQLIQSDNTNAKQQPYHTFSRIQQTGYQVQQQTQYKQNYQPPVVKNEWQSPNNPLGFAKPLQVVVNPRQTGNEIPQNHPVQTNHDNGSPQSVQQDNTMFNHVEDNHQKALAPKDEQLVLNKAELPGLPPLPNNNFGERQFNQIKAQPNDAQNNNMQNEQLPQRPQGDMPQDPTPIPLGKNPDPPPENPVLGGQLGSSITARIIVKNARTTIPSFHNAQTTIPPAMFYPKTTWGFLPAPEGTVRSDDCSGCFKRPYHYVLNSPEVCGTQGGSGHASIDLLVLITSSYDHRDRRNTIRRTWASVTANNRNVRVRYVFLLGHTSDEVDTQLSMERHVHKDLVVQSFIDAYKNLTLKTLMGLEWSEKHCPGAKNIMKTDDDVYVSINNLLRSLIGLMSYDNAIFGFCMMTAEPNRDPESKWFVSMRQYPHSEYPGFCSGTGYVMPRQVAQGILKVSANVPFFYLEDVYVAICARRIGVRLRNVFGFNNDKYPILPWGCDMYGRRNFFTSHRLSPDEMENVWGRCG